MIVASYSQLLQRKLLPACVVFPTLSGTLVLVSSLLPWLHDPLGANYNAWQLPVDLGFRVTVLNYGVVCLGSAGYCFSVAWQNWHGSGDESDQRRYGGYFHEYVVCGVVCLVPLALSLLQYLGLDLSTMSLLAQHSNQMGLIQSHYGYKVIGPLFSIKSLAADISSLQGRWLLLEDYGQPGLLLTGVSAWVSVGARQLGTSHSTGKQVRARRRWMTSMLVLAGVMLVLLVELMYASGWMVCEALAKESLANGNYANALLWFDRAATLNPSLEQVDFYHIERGQTLYFLYPGQQSDDSNAYLATLLSGHGDYNDAYQLLLAIERRDEAAPWVVEQIDTMLEKAAESARPLSGNLDLPASTGSLKKDSAALVWLQLLAREDPDNVYSHYMIGRIDYDMHSYSDCGKQLSMALTLSNDADFQSSSYTYMALSDAGLGDYAEERILLFTALRFDPGYHNNTAREELSGLR